MEKFVGREDEIKILNGALTSQKAELIAVYGRRRVGKTYMIETLYKDKILFQFTGLNRTDSTKQLEGFAHAMQKMLGQQTTVPITTPQNWFKAFWLLIDVLSAMPITEKRVIFLDEFPWIAGRKSDFLSAFDHFWNTWASRQENLVVVICGSAASWMIQNIVRNKGGLHNRITRRIRVEPFNLNETALFLKNKYVNLNQHEIIQLYMVTGGIPHYLNDVQAGESPIQAIDRMCFTKDGGLRKEFKELYQALFGRADKHICIIRALADKPSGLTRNDITAACGFTSVATTEKILDELAESGFITEYVPFKKNMKDAIFKLTDEYSLFYLKFMENNTSLGAGTWATKATGQSWKSWSGFAFENICLKHIEQIKKGLGIWGIYCEPSTWRYVPKTGEDGAQVDLLIDRQDNCINLCEIKFYNDEFELTKKDMENLKTKRRVFSAKNRVKKDDFYHHDDDFWREKK